MTPCEADRTALEAVEAHIAWAREQGHNPYRWLSAVGYSFAKRDHHRHNTATWDLALLVLFQVQRRGAPWSECRAPYFYLENTIKIIRADRLAA